MKSKKLKLEKFTITKLNKKSLSSINGGFNKGTDGGGQGETIIKTIGGDSPTRPTELDFNYKTR
ncbi:class I lanthipeptide [uncultured Tenacibaculum sp.]|uniref:class I lanthipeptide n=1 Tax=uncultured Tenacibaculum sp. TaxID=174713 RepID=UPI002610BD45|nr:class I lanthipeptide [uncultured Tenacibaculum sp.]